MLRATIYAIISTCFCRTYEFFANLVGTCYDPWELALLLVLSLDYGLDDGRMVGSKIDKHMGDTGLYFE
jgi:hypothetical protein